MEQQQPTSYSTSPEISALEIAAEQVGYRGVYVGAGGEQNGRGRGHM